MKKVARRFGRLKLNQKFTLVIFCVVLVPVVLLASVLLGNMQNVVTEDKMKDVERQLTEVRAGTEKAVELCNMTTQVFLNSPNLREFLVKAHNGDKFTAEELVAFQRGDVASFERMVNANPYLYQTRVYFEGEGLPEFMPVLYHESRMQNLSWADEDWVSGTWQLDYTDTLFAKEVVKPTPHIMSLVTVIEDYEYGAVGVLEVAIRMDELLPGLYGEEVLGPACFVSENGHIYAGKEQEAFWDEHLSEVLQAFGAGTADVQSAEVHIGGENLRVAQVALPQIGGQYITVVDLSEITAAMADRRNLFLLGTAVSLLLVALLVNGIVKAMLSRFYGVVDAMTEVREGNLFVKVPQDGSDEMALLGRRINEMMEQINALMQENINRQMLVKNSEIRALQSQINAHFIYNVLESIKMMAEVDGKYEMSDAITSLGRLLRYSMRFTSANVTVEDEVENIRNYLALINLRFDYCITLQEDLPEYVLQQRIPKLTLQPLVENAVVHGAEALAQDSVIELCARERDEAFLLEITDHGRGMDKETLHNLREKIKEKTEAATGKGIGLKNVHDRIVMAFGPEYGVEVESEEGRFTRVTIRIPYTQAPEAECEDVVNR
ncbi:sensor histidine kinase [Ruminococcaceae bacterium OttesenSCG-928-I18]|nr:sensor histidine kinase [Ruminococcaceae bacterium OttesenSCG-928-I18]